MKLRILLALSLTLLFQGPSFAVEPLRIDFEILSALIGPTKVNGASWDSPKGIDNASASLLSEMLMPGSGVAASAVISTVSNVAAKGAAAPDVIGYIRQKSTTTRQLAKIAGTPLALAIRRQKTQDSYTPRFYASYQGWPIYEDARFQIQLWDADVSFDDQIATVELTYDDIQEALEAGKPTWINVADQSLRQLLYVQISVTESHERTPAKMNGYQWTGKR